MDEHSLFLFTFIFGSSFVYYLCTRAKPIFLWFLVILLPINIFLIKLYYFFVVYVLFKLYTYGPGFKKKKMKELMAVNLAE